MSYQYKIKIPLVTTNGKVRIKRRKMIYEYGFSVATRQTPFSQDMYVEWQIGYDAILSDIEKGKKTTSLQDLTFTGANSKRKSLYELSEYVFHLAKNGLIDKQKINKLIDFVSAGEDLNLLENKLKIKRTNPVKILLNEITFETSSVEYPLLVHKFGDFDIVVEIITREKQYAVGIMPMLYLCFPITKLKTDTVLIGRTAEQKEEAEFVIDDSNADVFLEIFRLFGMLSVAHKHDVLEILKLIIDNV